MPVVLTIDETATLIALRSHAEGNTLQHLDAIIERAMKTTQLLERAAQ
jgi:hypothetical protein